MQKVTTFLMFKGKAEEAMDFYTTTFKDAEKINVFHNEDGTVLHGMFSIKGQTLMCIDSMQNQKFSFTPGMSLFVECDTVEELEELFSKLSEDGNVNMPITDTPVSEKFCWVDDQYGVSWQLNVSKAK
ncbi:Glyoxalase superfamily enzyme, possibly 3-demethylubiquinone-9 3-methyltransferase [Halobacillus karajensis]|uniref:3-demethylubiquinone-9 3-methyltransferase n=2 Tax=Halobacillus karajensis TaxID=195088 RepID=A0A024P8S2_9BACI|nr:3-demethylubiquinone-9 3-methyltransferase [Halobacillus karajensis]CDQ25325.1 3-demethylubiquinone-9 3-methyltransferase [Halobacillus karajensis]CDQ25952.1 3-demethylubiquinone-9 3-methyltransferase [Halobacillus karajensis]SEI10045.1 Glyoxalase superfamily enzyme, possibly 3-demethylubiquinone-9 3-methyltransferase [Halobacillus karajensis]